MDVRIILICLLELACRALAMGPEDSIDGMLGRVARSLQRQAMLRAPRAGFQDSEFTNERDDDDAWMMPMTEGGRYSLVELDILVSRRERMGRVFRYRELCRIFETRRAVLRRRAKLRQLRRRILLIRKKRKVTSRPSRLWSDINVYTTPGRVNIEVSIPVDFSGITLSLAARRRFESAFNQISEATCVRFTGVTPAQKRDPNFSFLDLRGGRTAGCASRIGRFGGVQPMFMGHRCIGETSVILHEFLHGVGLIHEQTRPDRDASIRVRWENVVPGREYNFVRMNPEIISTLNVPYDLRSIMHYSPYAFSRNNQATLQPLNGIPLSAVGRATRMSTNDISAVNQLYQCGRPSGRVHRLRGSGTGLRLLS